jgi:molybdenum cofactor cytidylyltransferase
MPDKNRSQKTNIAAVILAAGASIRMGQPKLLLQWKGKPLIHYPVTAAMEAGLAPILVVTGYQQIEIETALSNTPATFVHNPDWESGQSTTVLTALRALPGDIEAMVILLGDQPMVSSQAIRKLITFYLASDPKPMILAPAVDGKRANPVLFDHRVFPDLLNLQGDAGARQVFSIHPPQLLELNDPSLLFDVDSPVDYEKLQEQ